MTETFEETHPLLDALESLREIDRDWIREWGLGDEDADVVVRERMATLCLVVAAMSELMKQDRPAEPEIVRQKMVELDDGKGFVMDARSLRDLHEGFLRDGDLENAETCARAEAWLLLMGGAPRGAERS
jgi:hypothetical protein